MGEAKGKYNRGFSVNIPQDREELETAIREWAEGNPHLEEALRQCIEHGIETEACCAGHDGINNDPYISMTITDETRRRALSIMQSVFQKRSGIKSLNICNHTQHGYTAAELVIHAKPGQKNRIFDLIAEGAKKEIDLESCHPIIQAMMTIEKQAEQLKLYSHVFGLESIGPIDAVVLFNDTVRSNPNLYDRKKHSINPCISDSQILGQLSDIAEAMGTHLPETTQKKGLIERVRQSLIQKLERDLAVPEPYVDLTKLSDEERERAFVEFGEGSRELTRFLKTAYEHGAPSMFCCSGHGGSRGYVMLKVTDENLELLRKLGKALSRFGIVTNFDNEFHYGKRVIYDCSDNLTPSSFWFGLAADIIENPSAYECDNPTMYYHEEMPEIPNMQPGVATKVRLLRFLRGKQPASLTDGTNLTPTSPHTAHSWDLTPEDRARMNTRTNPTMPRVNQTGTNQIKDDETRED
ncbi:MAG: hypothetical protein IKP28_00705 [Clostridia bacterium]|nr:hypothetical protein [Clostridia bacterium]